MQISEKIHEVAFMFDISIPKVDEFEAMFLTTQKSFTIMLVSNRFDLIINKLEEEKIIVINSRDRNNYEIMNINDFKLFIQSYWQQVDILSKS